jgi:hypothetical protein
MFWYLIALAALAVLARALYLRERRKTARTKMAWIREVKNMNLLELAEAKEEIRAIERELGIHG